MEQKRVLLVSENNGFRGGIDTFLLNWVKCANKEQFRFIWYIPGKITDKDFVEEFKREGVSVVEGQRITPGVRNSSFRGFIMEKYGILRDIRSILKTQKIDIIHVNAGHPRWQTLILPVATVCRIKCRIMHGHNTTQQLRFSGRLMEAMGKCVIAIFATNKAACSRQAAEYFFGRKAAFRTVIVKYCIETKKFAFSKEIRDRYRRQNDFDNKFVIGHVGRFFPQKNHEFLIDIFRVIVEKEPNARLLLTGEGMLESQIREKVERCNLLDKVTFAGASDSVQDYMCAMDIFVLPSLYEGFGIVNIEAQASGLPCIISDVVPEEAAITDLVQYVPLETGAEYWAGRILEYRDFSDIDARSQAYKRIKKAGYDVDNMDKQITKLYLGK